VAVDLCDECQSDRFRLAEALRRAMERESE
jgi:hypothetical protein